MDILHVNVHQNVAVEATTQNVIIAGNSGIYHVIVPTLGRINPNDAIIAKKSAILAVIVLVVTEKN